MTSGNIESGRLAHKYVKRTVTLAFLVFMIFLSYYEIVPNSLDIHTDSIAAENIIAPRRIVDTQATRNLQELAADRTPPVYDYINSAAEMTKNNVASLFEALISIYPENLDSNSVVMLNHFCATTFTEDDFSWVLRMNTTAKMNLNDIAGEVLNDLYANQVKASEIESIRNSIRSRLDRYDLSGQDAAFLTRVLSSALQPDYVLNEKLTTEAMENARQSVFEVVYETGQTIINKGSIVTEEQVSLLRENGMLRRNGLFENPAFDVARLSLITAFVLMFVSYIFFFHKEITARNKMYVLLISQFVFMLIIAKFLGFFSILLIPVSFLSMSLCIIFSARVAVQCNVFLMLFLSVVLQLDIDSMLYLLISGYLGVVYMRQVNSRLDSIKAGLVVSLANAVVIAVFGGLRNNFTFLTVYNAIFGLSNGILAALLATATLMIWESVFAITTPFRLLEMSAPGDPLIQKLIKNAPGTYNHCLLVSNISEVACKRIGANALLARVGAYYHDIGKVEKASYFKENQQPGRNPHDNILPEVSARIIKNHISDGIYLAEKQRIPAEITEFIRTHHGTSEISFFKKEAEAHGYDGDENFTYSGDLPVSRETTIVMLADSVEAAVRSMDIHNEEAISAMVDRIVIRKEKEGQLKASELSFMELEEVKMAFTSALVSVYHSRLKYPDTADNADDILPLTGEDEFNTAYTSPQVPQSGVVDESSVIREDKPDEPELSAGMPEDIQVDNATIEQAGEKSNIPQEAGGENKNESSGTE